LAAEELDHLGRFRIALEAIPGATCPEPVGLVDEPAPGFRMRFARGIEVIDLLRAENLGKEGVEAHARTMALVLEAYIEHIGEPYRDFKLRNMLYDRREQQLVFVDLGEPQDAGAPDPGDSPYEVSVGNFLASMLFESARPKYRTSPRLHRQSKVLALALVAELRGRGAGLRPERLQAIARRDYLRSTFGRRSPARTAWYATVGWALGLRIPLPGGEIAVVPYWQAR
jgi:hypothetical protein